MSETMCNVGATRRQFVKACAAVSVAATLTTGAVPALADKAAADATAGEGDSESRTPSNMVPGYYTQVDWLGEKPVVAEDRIAATADYDVVVVGCGHSGAQVALAAAEEGLSVAVVERCEEDGLLEIGSEVGTFNSTYVQQRWGIPESDLSEVLDEFVKRGNGQVNPAIIRKYVFNSGETFDHYVETIQNSRYAGILDEDCAFLHVNINEDGTQNYSNYPIVESGGRSWAGCVMFKVARDATEDPSGGRGHNGPLMLRAQIERAQELGTTLYWGHKAIVLDQAESGAVTGVVCEAPDGSCIRLNAGKGVAVCCGDFSTNPEMVSSLLPELLEWNLRNGMTYDEALSGLTGMGRDGYGQKMCCWAGGYIEEAPRATQQAGTVSNGKADIPAGPFGAASFLELNRYGKRFMNESDYYSARGVTARQPKGLVATVTDTQYIKSVANSGIYHGGPNFGRGYFYDDVVSSFEEAGKTPGEHEVSVASIQYRGKATVYTANTLEELAGYLGYEGDAVQMFVAEVERYNQMCEQGHDDDFGKDPSCLVPVNQPPYFGWVGQNNGSVSLGLVTLSGMVTDENFNVLDGDLNPIEGLYVAGNCLGGRYANVYPGVVAGNSIGMAITHGRVLGKYLASL